MVLAFVLAAGATFLLAARARQNFRMMRGENEPIRAWMSIPFVAHAHHVPQSVLFAAIGVAPQAARDHRPIRIIARETHRPVSDIEAQLQHAIDASQHPPGGPQQ
jgi:hypothetical protein